MTSVRSRETQKELEAILHQLESSAPAPRPRPGQDIDAIMYAAGQANIVDIFRRIVEEPKD